MSESHDNDAACSICYDELGKQFVFGYETCRRFHLFCKDCFLELQHIDGCPICRTEISGISAFSEYPLASFDLSVDQFIFFTKRVKEIETCEIVQSKWTHLYDELKEAEDEFFDFLQRNISHVDLLEKKEKEISLQFENNKKGPEKQFFLHFPNDLGHYCREFHEGMRFSSIMGTLSNASRYEMISFILRSQLIHMKLDVFTVPDLLVLFGCSFLWSNYDVEDDRCLICGSVVNDEDHCRFTKCGHKLCRQCFTWSKIKDFNCIVHSASKIIPLDDSEDRQEIEDVIEDHCMQIAMQYQKIRELMESFNNGQWSTELKEATFEGESTNCHWEDEHLSSFISLDTINVPVIIKVYRYLHHRRIQHLMRRVFDTYEKFVKKLDGTKTKEESRIGHDYLNKLLKQLNKERLSNIKIPTCLF